MGSNKMIRGWGGLRIRLFGSDTSLASRRIRVLSIVSLCVSALAFVFFVYDITFNEYGMLRFRISEAFLCVAFAVAAFMSRRSFAFAGTLFLILLFCLSVGLPLQTGRISGLHFFLLAIAPIVPILFGTRRPILIAAAASLSAFAFLAIEFTIPNYIVLYRPWLSQIRIPFEESLDIDYSDGIFILVIIALQIILTVTTFAAFRITESAEAALEREYSRSELLLQSLLPRPIAARLKDKPDGVIADEFDLVTVLFADVVNFTPKASVKKPDAVVKFLERIFGEFDTLAEKHGLEKIKTIGDAYMVAGGMPEPGGDHTYAVANMALDMIDAAERLTQEFGEEVSVRIGFHAGPAIAGVIGRRKPFYDVWGDTINVAARMESSGTPGRIQITPEVKDILGSRFLIEPRGTVEIKGKGPMPLYYLNGRSG